MRKSQNGGATALIGILICDDNAEIRAMLTEVITLEPGLRVVGQARDGNEVVEQARLLQPDVIILDLAMPDRNGLEALPELALAAPAAKTIVVSAYAAPRIVAETLRKGAFRYVEKGNLMVGELLGAIVASFESAPADRRTG